MKYLANFLINCNENGVCQMVAVVHRLREVHSNSKPLMYGLGFVEVVFSILRIWPLWNSRKSKGLQL
jgi:hypothetical protein